MSYAPLAVDGGKYTFFVPSGDYRVHILRHSEPWLVIEQGCNAIFSLVAELSESRELIAAVREWVGIGPKAGHHGELAEAFRKFVSVRGEVVLPISDRAAADLNEAENALIKAALGISHPGRAPRLSELDALTDAAMSYAAARRIGDCVDDACPQHSACRGCGDDIPLGTTSCGALECGGRALADILGSNAP